MQTVQITAFNAAGRPVFFALGMGMSFAAARAQARVNYRARLHSLPAATVDGIRTQAVEAI